MQLHCDNNLICIDDAVSDTTCFHQTTTANSTENVYYIILDSLRIIIICIILLCVPILNYLNVSTVMQLVSRTVSFEIQTVIIIINEYT